jgi:Omp85 superfamily domain
MKTLALTVCTTFLCLLICTIPAHTQLAFQDLAVSLPVSKKSVQMDVGDLFRYILKTKIPLKKDSKPTTVFISALPALNYSIVTGFSGGALTNVSFYTKCDDITKLSAVNTSINYSQYKQLSIVSTSNVWTNGNKWNLVGDWRFYNFNTYTYGLGSFSALNQKDWIKYQHFRLYQVAQREIAKHFTAGIGYHLDKYWNIKDTRATEGEQTEFSRYGFNEKSQSSGVSLNLQFDSRRNPVNAERGTYASIQYRNYSKLIGSNTAFQSLFIDFKQYFKLSKQSNSTLAFWNYAWFTLKGKPPYLDLPNTGFDARANSGRGYAVGRYRGQNMLYSEAEYRFDILKNGLLGGVVFANMQSLSEYPKNVFKKMLPGGGAGVRLKLNKNSNTNIAVDYGIGVEGSRGFFFTLGEAF